MLNNEEVRKEIINYLGKRNLNKLKEFNDKYRTPFPLIVEDGVPISFHIYMQIPLNNYINEKFNAVPDHINNWITFEDYIYNMVKDILKDYK